MAIGGTSERSDARLAVTLTRIEDLDDVVEKPIHRKSLGTVVECQDL